MNIASAVEEPALQADFFDEKGVLKEYRPKSIVCSLRYIR